MKGWAAALLLLAASARGACPTPSGPLPSSFSYEVRDGRHEAVASAVLPQPQAAIAPIAAAVQAEPTWTNMDDDGPVPGPVELTSLVDNDKFKEHELRLDAVADGECPGATRVTARFAWRFGTLARLMGGDAKDIPALFALAARDEVIARAFTTPEQAAARVGPAPAPDLELLRVAPAGLLVPEASLAALRPRLEALRGPKAELGEVLSLFYDLHRNATALAGFAALSRKAEAPHVQVGRCTSCILGYDLSVTRNPDGKGGSIQVGLNDYERLTSPTPSP